MSTPTTTPNTAYDSLYSPGLVHGSEIESLREKYCRDCQNNIKCEVMEGLADHVLFESIPPPEIKRRTEHPENFKNLVCKCFSSKDL